MIGQLTTWWRDRQLRKALGGMRAAEVLDTTMLCAAIHREAHEQYTLGCCTATVMKDLGRAGKLALEKRLAKVNTKDPVKEALVLTKAQTLWLSS